MTRSLPYAGTLEAAITAIIANNQQNGYYPKRLIRLLSGRSGGELRERCARAITESWFFHEYLLVIYRNHQIVSLEEMVAHYGDRWGFTGGVVQFARMRAMMLRPVDAE